MPSNHKYKCPFCEEKYLREDLAQHIEEEHEDLIPQGFTPNRLVFQAVNNKDHGSCVVCGRETEWMEERCKYNRICGRKECKDKLRQAALKNHIKVYNKPTLLGDEMHQEKMLRGRHISGTYKFRDGGVLDYVGTFEKKLLEFFDKVLECKSADILAPGPVLEYKHNGEKKKWITDFLYIPYNLVIEVKDGGDNPNKRQMPDYRKKQEEKEMMIEKLDKYNYVRVTNNNFAQLLEVFAELRMRMINDDDRKLIKVNEDASVMRLGGLKFDVEAFRFDEFKNKQLKVCIVTGHSGGGKSTLSKLICEKYGATYISLDHFMFIKKEKGFKDEYTAKYFKTHPDKKILPREKILLHQGQEKYFGDIEDYAVWVKKEYTKNGNQIVIEGTVLSEMYMAGYREVFKDSAIVILGTTMGRAIINRLKRDHTNPKWWPSQYGMYKATDVALSGMRDDLNDSV